MSKKNTIDELIEDGTIDKMAGDMSPGEKAAAIALARKMSDAFVDAFEKLGKASLDPEVRAAMLRHFKGAPSPCKMDWKSVGQPEPVDDAREKSDG
jgi:hypothetical protein